MNRTLALLGCTTLAATLAAPAMAQTTNGEVWVAQAPAQTAPKVTYVQVEPQPPQAAPPVTYVPVRSRAQEPAEQMARPAQQAAPPAEQQVPASPQAIQPEAQRGQWVQTQGSGWIWVPEATTTYAIGGVPYAISTPLPTGGPGTRPRGLGSVRVRAVGHAPVAVRVPRVGVRGAGLGMARRRVRLRRGPLRWRLLRRRRPVLRGRRPRRRRPRRPPLSELGGLTGGDAQAGAGPTTQLGGGTRRAAFGFIFAAALMDILAIGSSSRCCRTW